MLLLLQAHAWRCSLLHALRSGPFFTPQFLCSCPAEHVLQDRPLPDLRAGATSLAGLLRSGLGRGLGRFGLQAGPKPSDCATVILFVLGGISLAELHDIQQAVDERAAAASAGPPPPPPRILVGATALLQPGDLCLRLFAGLGRA